jgi:3-oxoacyl-[acyl-carrier-protein] synthase II
VDELDPECELPAAGLVMNQPREAGPINVVLNNSFGMLGINSAVIVQRFVG